MPKSKRAWDVYSKTLIHSAILEGSKGGSWKSIGRFAYHVFLSLGLPRGIRMHKGPLHLLHGTKRRKLEIVCTSTSTHLYSFRLGQGSRRFTNGFGEAP